MTYPRKAKPRNAYESGRASLSLTWIAERPLEWLNGQLQLTGKLAQSSDFHRGRLDIIRAELKRRGANNQS
jgi:hypothetical protein